MPGRFVDEEDDPYTIGIWRESKVATKERPSSGVDGACIQGIQLARARARSSWEGPKGG